MSEPMGSTAARPPGGSRYEAAGVDRSRASEAIRRIREASASTHGPEVLSGIGGFGGCFALGDGPGDAVLVASVDGVGTKMKLALQTGLWENVGYDIVAHGVGDVLVQGAKPLFFLDYIAMGRLDPDVIEGMARGMARACREAGCALLGGETAEMPGVYGPGETELVGVVVGSVARDRVMDGSAIREGDRVIGLPSSGLHTNGYTLARQVFEGENLRSVFPPLEVPLGEALMASHTLYLPAVAPLLDAGLIHGMAHITGGGLIENIPRVLPEGLEAVLHRGTWPVPPIFDLIARRGSVAADEMFRVFNMGIGWVLMAAPEAAPIALAMLAAGGRDAWVVGAVGAGRRGARLSEDSPGG